MLKKSIRFIDENDNEQVFLEQVNTINPKSSPFKEMIKNGNYYSYSAIFNNIEEYKLSLEEAMHLLVNVKETGSFHFFFVSKFFNKNEIIQAVSNLKEIENPKEKVDLLFNTLKDQNILFAIYVPKGENKLPKDDLMQFNENIFYVDDTGTKEEAATKSIKEKKEKIKKPMAENKKERNDKNLLTSIKKKFLKFFEPLFDEKIAFVFASISSLIISIASIMAIYYCYTGRQVYYVFFAFSLVGGVFNFIIFKDYLNKNKLKVNNLVISLMFAAIGFLVGVGFYYLFLSIANDIPESLTDVGTAVIYAVGIYIGLELLSIVAAAIYSHFHRLNKEK